MDTADKVDLDIADKPAGDLDNEDNVEDNSAHAADSQADSSTVGGVVVLMYPHLGSLPICFPQKYWPKH